MQVALLTTSLIPSRAANSVQVVKMAAALQAIGHPTTLYGARGPLPQDPHEFYAIDRSVQLALADRSPEGKLGALRYLGTQSQSLWAAPPADLYIGRAARLLHAIAPRRRPLRFEAHVLPPHGARREILRALFRLRNFDRLICISEALADDFAQAFSGLNRADILVAHDGASPLVPPSGQENTGSPWPGRPGVLQVGYVGGIYPGRGIEMLLRLGRELPGLDFHIVGGSPDVIETMVNPEAQPNIFFHGHVPHRELAAIYAHLDVLTAPYGARVAVHGGGGDIRRWMSPLKIFEYMSAGRPIVTSDLPVLREVLRDGDNALLLPVGDADAWARTLQRLDTDAKLRARLGARALADFEAHHTWTRRAEILTQGL